MPPKRRTNTPRTTATTRQQSTLSFGGKNKVTKPTSPRNNKAAKKDPALLDDIVNAELEPTTAENVIADQVKEELEDPLHDKSTTTEDVLGGRAERSETGATGGATGTGWVGDEERTARNTSEEQIRKYWRAKEKERKAPRVHQQDLSVHEKVLREWDMSGQFGVSFVSGDGC